MELDCGGIKGGWMRIADAKKGYASKYLQSLFTIYFIFIITF